jgi:hypothetical protein
MKENEVNEKNEGNPAERRLRERLAVRLLLRRAAPGDHLMLADATLLAALDGSRPLTANERAALTRSPLTLRRLRQLSNQLRVAAEPLWLRSAGMLRAAASSATLDRLVTDDGCWALHFLPEGEGWSVILALAAEAPFAPRLMRQQPMLRVLDGGGAIVLQGRLDADGECEHGWPFDMAPARHFQLHGGAFAVEAAAP